MILGIGENKLILEKAKQSCFSHIWRVLLLYDQIIMENIEKIISFKLYRLKINFTQKFYDDSNAKTVFDFSHYILR